MIGILKWLNSEPAESPAPPLCSVDELRQRSLRALADCTRPHDEHVRCRLSKAATAQQLWQMRSDIYQAVARQHCEAEAVRRLNELSPAFEGWLPPAAMVARKPAA